MSAQSGQLILILDEATENVTYECHLNESLHVGSDKNAANVCLSGLKNLAFSIYIDTFGRVCINILMKRIQINGKRVPKNAVRPLVNNTAIEAGEHKFVWKYNSKCSRSYSLSPCRRNDRDVDMFIRNRKTINCFAIGSLNDENAATIDAKSEEEANNDQKSEPVPVIKGDIPENVKNSTKKRTSLIPVKPNRTSELRRSIIRSKSVSHEPIPFHYKTPKKPVPSAVMAKSVNAIIRSESRLDDRQPSQTTRKSLGANVNFPKIIEGMNLFNVVTNDMKTVGPSKYHPASATNSPKRTPKKALIKPKRLSLRSELTEMGIMRTMEEAILSEDQKQSEINATPKGTPETLPSTAELLSTPEADAVLENSSEANSTFTTTSEANASVTRSSDANASFTITSEANAGFTTPKVNASVTRSSEANASFTITSEANAGFTTPKVNASVTRSSEANASFTITSEANAGFTTPKVNASVTRSSEANASFTITSEANAGFTTPKVNASVTRSSEANASFTITSEANAGFTTPKVNASVTRSSEANATLNCTFEAKDSLTSIQDTNATSPNSNEAEIVDLNDAQATDKGSTNISSAERYDTALINTPDTQTENVNTPEPKQPCLSSRLTSSSSVEIIDDSVEFCLIADDDTDDESSDSEFSIISVDDDSEIVESETSPEIIASTLTRMKSENSVTDKSITTEAGCEEIDQPEQSQRNASPESSSEKSVSESRLPSVSTPTKVLPIRAIRNSRLCSLDECCSPSTAYTTPTKSKLSTNVVATPRSILKTPKASKTPKKSVRIAAILHEVHEEEDDVPITTSESTDAQTSVTDRSVPYQNDIGTEPLEMSVDANNVQPENNSMDENDEFFTPINNKTGPASSLNGECTMKSDSEIILPAEINFSTPSSQPNEVLAATSMVVQKAELIETPVEIVTATVVDTSICSAEPKLSDAATDVTDIAAKVSGPSDDPVDELNETKVDSTNISQNEREETNLFDETFEIQSESEDIDPIQSTVVIDENDHLKTIIGVKELVNTPKALDKTNLVGIKELLQTPSGGLSRSEDMRGIKELLNTPKALDKTNLVGMKELLRTPSDSLSRSEDMRGVKELLNTPKDLDKTNLVGMKELLQTPSDRLSASDDMRGVKELLNTPKALDKTNLVGMKELLNTPDAMNKSVDMRGVRGLLKTPKMLDRTNFIGVKELLKTPENQDDSHLEGVQDLLESPVVPAEQIQSNQSADKRFCVNLRYNSRNSLINLVNNHMRVIGLPIVTAEELLPVAPIAVHAPVAPIAVHAPVEPTAEQAAVEPTAEQVAVEPIAEKAEVEPIAEKAEVEPIAEKAEVEPIAEKAEVEPIAEKVAVVPAVIPTQQEVPLMSDAESNEEPIDDSKALQPENDQSLKVEKVPDHQTPNDVIVEVVEANVEPTITAASATNKKVSEGKSTDIESNKLAPPKNESKNTKTPRKTRNRQSSAIELQASEEEIVPENVEAKEATTMPSKATKSVTSKVEPKTPSRTRKQKAETEAMTSKPVTAKVEPKVLKTPAKTRKVKASVVEPPESQDENVSESDDASEAIKPANSKIKSETTKTTSRTRKGKSSVAEVSEGDEASEATKPVNSKAESKTTKTPSRTRQRKASVVKVPKSQNEIVSESDEATDTTKPVAKVVGTRKRKASASVNYKAPEAGPSTAESEVPKTRRRKADQVEPVTENVLEQAEIEPSKVEPTIPKKSRKRQASAMEPPESIENVGTKTTKTRKRNASTSANSRSTELTKSSPPSSSELKHPKKRQRQASDTDQLESQDEIVSETSLATEATDSEPLNVAAVVTKSRKRTVRQDPPTKATKSTRSALNVEPASEVIEKPTKAASKRTRQMTKTVPSEKVAPKSKEADLSDAEDTVSSSTSVPETATTNKAAKGTRSRKTSEAANLSHESTSSTTTRSNRRGKTTKTAAPVAEKRPRRGMK